MLLNDLLLLISDFFDIHKLLDRAARFDFVADEEFEKIFVVFLGCNSKNLVKHSHQKKKYNPAKSQPILRL